MTDDLHAAVSARLAARDHRYTTNRRRVVDLLDRAAHPTTIREIVAHDEVLAISSAYRNLSILAESGVVHRVTSTDEFARYELAEDLTDHHHHHLICSGCGSVDDFTVGAQIETTLARALSAVAAHTGFQIESHRLDLVGRCARCSR